MASTHTTTANANVQCMYCAVARLLSDTGRPIAEDVPRNDECAGCRARVPAMARPKSVDELKERMGVAGSSREGRQHAQRDPNATLRSGSSSTTTGTPTGTGGDRTITGRTTSGAGVTQLTGGVNAARPRTAPSTTPSPTPTPHTLHARTSRIGDSITASRYADFDAYVATAEAREAKRAAVASGSSPAHAWLSLYRTGTVTTKLRSSSATRSQSSSTIIVPPSSSSSASSPPSPTSPRLKRAATAPTTNSNATFPPAAPSPGPSSAKLEMLATSYARARLAWYKSNVHRIPPAIDADELERMYRAYIQTCPSSSGKEHDDGLPPLVCSKERAERLRGGKEAPNFPVRDIWTALGGEPDDGWEILEAVDRERR